MSQWCRDTCPAPSPQHTTKSEESWEIRSRPPDWLMTKGAFGEQEARTPPVWAPSTAELRHALGPVGTATFHHYGGEICEFSSFHTCPSVKEKLVELNPNPPQKNNKNQKPEANWRKTGHPCGVLALASMLMMRVVCREWLPLHLLHPSHLRRLCSNVNSVVMT